MVDEKKVHALDSCAECSADPAVCDMLGHAAELEVTTAWDRYKAQQPQCRFGLQGVCCRICIQGPCRIIPNKPGADAGICGAKDYTIVARNVVRYVAGGASCHSDHARHVAHTLLEVAEGNAPDYKITDPDKLRQVAQRIGIDVAGKEENELAKEVALAALNEFGRQTDEPCTWLETTVTDGRNQKFLHCNVAPSSIDRTVVEMLHQTAMGMDADPVNIIFGGIKTALADYVGMHIGTDLSDILFGTPEPVKSEANLGTIKEDYVNIAIHGHEPTLSSMVVQAAREMDDAAKKAGAKGVNVVGICCTGNEMLMREGVYLATNSAAQELAVVTGLLDAMVVDIQCIMPSLRQLTECYHTELITTSKIAKIPGATHVPFREATAMADARSMVEMAIAAYGQRDAAMAKPSQYKSKAIAGFSTEALMNLFKAVNPKNPISVLTDAILSGELRGVTVMAGCNNQKGVHDEGHLAVAKELAANDILILATGCSAISSAKHGLANWDAVEQYAGEGLLKFLTRLAEANELEGELPLVFHVGSCVDNTRAADLCTLMAKELDVDVPKVPFGASAPEAMHEKAVSIGTWCVAMGLPTHVGVMPHIEGSQLVYGIATQIARDVYGGHFIFETDPVKGAQKLLEKLDDRAWKLRVHKSAAEKYGTDVASSW